ncbi:MAG: tandem-95 repeat protein [Chitinophagaceae bacterium]|nr:tandem-95 repeat protein [Chitinophagaceae bacterium]
MKSSIAGSNRLKNLLIWLVALFLSANAYAGVSVNFNKVYKATGTAYDAQTNTAAITTSIVGTDFKFEDPNQPTAFNGNYVRGILTYTNSSGQVVTVYGEINRRAKTGGPGDNTICFYMVAISNNDLANPVYSGEAYLLIHPVNGPANVSDNSNVATSSDPIASALNDMLALQPSISSQMSTAGQTVCLNGAITPLQLTATISSGTLSEVKWYQSTTNANAGGTLVSTVALTGTSQTITYTPTSSTTGDSYYYAIITGSSGLKTTSNVSGKITVLDQPTISGVTGTLSICSGLTTTLTAASATSSPTYKWYTAATGGTLLYTGASYTTAALTTTTSFYVDVTNGGGCTSASRTATTVTVNALPTISGVSGTLSICSGLTTTLTAASATSSPTYKWYTAATGGTLLYTGAAYTTAALTTTTSFYVDVTNTGGCTSASRTTATVTVNALPTISGVTGTLSICSGLTTTLTAASATSTPTYKWYDAATGGTLLYTGAAYTTAALTTTTSFYVDVTNGSGCSSASRTATTVTVNAIPTISSVTGTLSICSGQSTTLVASSASTSPTYKWYDAAAGGTLLYTGASYTTAALTTTTSFYVEVTSGAGCTSASRTSTTVTVISGAAPVISGVTGGTEICAGLSTTLTAASSTTSPTFYWYDNVIAGNLLHTGASYTTGVLTTTTNFYVEVTNGTGCTSTPRTATTVTVNALPTISGVTGTLTICSGLTTTLTAASATSTPTYKWYSAATGGTLLYTGAAYTTTALTTTTSFYVEVTSAGGCVSASRTQVTVTVNSKPTVSVSPATVTIKLGNAAILTAAGANSYSWLPVTGLSASNTVSATANPTVTTTYTVTGTSTSSGCTNTATVTVTVAAETNPDVNATNVNVPVNGNVSTNDVTPAGSSYGTPIPASGNPTGATITMNTDGTYVFKATQPGTYTYQVPLCAAGQTSNCPTKALVITVSDPARTDNPPVANLDIVTALPGATTTTNILANDKCSNTGCSLNTSSVTIVTAPLNATATVNADGTINYTPKPGFAGTDSLQYRVCDNATPANCATAWVYYTVPAADAAPVTIATDDYASTPAGVATSGNILTNDKNTGGGTLSVTANASVPASKGVLVINTDGSYTFTPAAGFSGPIDVAYTVCGGTPSTCAKATLYLLVNPPAQLNPDVNATNVNVAVNGNVSTNDVIPSGSSYGTPVPASGNPSGATITMNTDGTYVFKASKPGTYTYQVPLCAPGQTANCPSTSLVITVKDPVRTDNPPVANLDIVTALPGATTITNILANDKCSNNGCSLNTASVTIVTAPLNGTATVNADGTMNYTPKPGFSGRDSLQYKVCDNASPANCATAWVYYTVPAADAAPVTVATDDYANTYAGVATSGNLLTNDKNTGGGTLSVTANGSVPASKGVLVINADGSYTFTPAAGFNGPIDVAYTVCGGTPSSCAKATLHILVNPLAQLNPDVNATNVNIAVNGNVSTNDVIPTGSSYGTPVPASGNPSGATITMNTDGTYVFKASTPGTYTYQVPLCVPGQTSNCATTSLVITVKDPVRTDNPPVVNLDIVRALPGETTTTNILANDKCSNIGCSLNTASVTIITDPLNGTVSVNADGTINYTPKPGFSGTDSLRYRVCDNGTPANCATAWVYYTVPVDPDPITIATDDYASTTVGTEIKGSLINNDKNTGKAALTVTAIGTVPASKGVLVINTDGTYTFTPAPGFTGPIEVAYTVCGGTPSTCAKATLYLLIEYPAVDPPKATGGTYNAGDPSNPVNIGKTVSAPPAGSKTIYCDVNGNNCSTTVPLLPTKPGIYVWCVKNIDTISNISSTPCVYDTIRILPTVTTVNATYVLGGIGLPTNISGLIKTITAGSKPQWCDVNGQNCTTTAPALPNKLGVFVWCVKAIDTASGLVSTPCKYDTVTIIAPQTVMEVTKRFESIKLQSDGSFLAVFKIKTTNLMNVKMDSVQVKDDLSKVFTSASDYSIVNVQATGTLVANALYNGSGVIDLLTLQSSLAANKSDSITLSIKINASATSGNYNNVAIMQGNTPYGRAQLASNDPVANPSDPYNRLATKFQVPKLDIIIPGGFSPNQDGVDDKFIITRPYGTRIALQVFNRWGNQVYQNGDYRNDWDGRGSGNFMGQYVPEGTYYYVVVATDATGTVQKFAGPLTIVR